MTDAFSDVQSTVTEDTSTDSGESTDSEAQSVTSFTATDAPLPFMDEGSVRSTLPDPDERYTQKRYSDPDSENKADDVDARGLFRQPTLNELRYYAREGPYGWTIVEKPIEDIFKHGFTIRGDNTERDKDERGAIEDFLLDEYLEYYKLAEKKSRRDGMCILMLQLADSASSVAEPVPSEGGSFEGFQIWTLDNLSDNLAETTVAKNTEYDEDQIYVSQGAVNGGIAVVDDISSPDHGEVVGYGVAPRQESEDVEPVFFVHESRCQAFRWGEWVDGPLGNNLTGKHLGESVLTPVLQPLKGAQMGYWAMMNILHRYSAPLHAIEPPESWSQDDWDEAEQRLDNVSAKSDALLPPGAEMSIAEAVSEFDPEPVYSVLIESICAGTVFTKPVLQGTQTGTVSGSETDIKNYFNAVDLLRMERTVQKFREIVRMVANIDQKTIPRVAGVTDFEVDFGPMFKPTDIEQAEGMVSVITAATNGIKNYVLTPDEARSIVEEQWAELDAEVNFDDLSEDEWDQLDRINMNEAGQGASDNDPGQSPRNNPRLRNGGGQQQGENRESSQPTRMSADSFVEDLSDDQLDALVDELEARRSQTDE